ncbi:hypothetical protein ACVW2L_004053 [Mucilaginibacter sp. HD30]
MGKPILGRESGTKNAYFVFVLINSNLTQIHS